MDTGKMKIMFSCSMKDRVELEDKGKWPCGVCKKGVGNNSILCHGCKKWIHKRCSGVKGSLCNVSQSFICRCCNTLQHLQMNDWLALHVDFLSLNYIVYESISYNHGTKLNYLFIIIYYLHYNIQEDAK